MGVLKELEYFAQWESERGWRFYTWMSLCGWRMARKMAKMVGSASSVKFTFRLRTCVKFTV